MFTGVCLLGFTFYFLSKRSHLAFVYFRGNAWHSLHYLKTKNKSSSCFSHIKFFLEIVYLLESSEGKKNIFEDNYSLKLLERQKFRFHSNRDPVWQLSERRQRQKWLHDSWPEEESGHEYPPSEEGPFMNRHDIISATQYGPVPSYQGFLSCFDAEKVLHLRYCVFQEGDRNTSHVWKWFSPWPNVPRRHI